MAGRSAPAAAITRASTALVAAALAGLLPAAAVRAQEGAAPDTSATPASSAVPGSSAVPASTAPTSPSSGAAASTSAATGTAPAAPTSATASFTSTFSEVDACNRAQQDLPASAVVTGMWVRQQMGATSGYSFRCDVRWSTAAAAKPTLMPITFGPVWR